MRSQIIGTLAVTATINAAAAFAADKPSLTPHKDPQDGCCEGHAVSWPTTGSTPSPSPGTTRTKYPLRSPTRFRNAPTGNRV